MDQIFWVVFGASSLATLVTTLGIYVIHYFKEWGEKNSIYFVCFAAGVLISVSFSTYYPGIF